jgi:hypothetical protein
MAPLRTPRTGPAISTTYGNFNRRIAIPKSKTTITHAPKWFQPSPVFGSVLFTGDAKHKDRQAAHCAILRGTANCPQLLSQNFLVAFVHFDLLKTGDEKTRVGWFLFLKIVPMLHRHNLKQFTGTLVRRGSLT